MKLLLVTKRVTPVTSQVCTNDHLSNKVKDMLSKTPGLSIKEIARASKVSRQFMAGFLKALEEKGDVYSRKVGPARIYFNNEVRHGG
jgi:predicted transcriptional regulator